MPLFMHYGGPDNTGTRDVYGPPELWRHRKNPKQRQPQDSNLRLHKSTITAQSNPKETAAYGVTVTLLITAVAETVPLVSRPVTGIPTYTSVFIEMVCVLPICDQAVPSVLL